jgi:hypothetical protein
MVDGALTLFTACPVGPNYVRPTAEVRASDREVCGWKVGQPKDEESNGH